MESFPDPTTLTDLEIDNKNLVLDNNQQDTSIDNPINSLNRFSKNIHFKNSSTSYRNFFIGLIGDGTNNTNQLAFCVNQGGSPDPNIIMSMTNDNVFFGGRIYIEQVYPYGSTVLIPNIETSTISNLNTKISGIDSSIASNSSSITTLNTKTQNISI